MKKFEKSASVDKEVIEVYEGFQKGKVEISTDSRRNCKGKIFIALNGNTYKGHDFMEEAIEKGAQHIVVMEGWNGMKKKHIRYTQVKDTKQFLLQLAHYHRKMTEAKVILIAGSVGKTTMRYLMSQLLLKEGYVVSTKDNQNNELGVAFTVLKINTKTQFAVIEGGARQVGDHQLIDQIVQPDILVLTPSGYDHLGPMKGYKGIEKCIKELTDGAMLRGIKVIFSKEDHVASKLLVGYQNGVQVGLEKEGIQLTDRKKGPWPFLWEKTLSMAIRVKKELGELKERDIRVLWRAHPVKLRGSWEYRKGCWIFQDSFNANRTSLTASLEYFWERWGKGEFVCVIGQMADLGSYSFVEHQKVMKRIKEKQNEMKWRDEQFVFIGEDWEKCGKGRYLVLKKREDLRIWWKNFYKKGFVFVKGANFLNLNKEIK